jgi:hypothetical protein
MEQHPEPLSQEELEAQDAQALPDREAMSTISLDPAGIDNFAMPINEATAINSESTGSTAYAAANQTVILGQTDLEADDPGSHHHD